MEKEGLLQYCCAGKKTICFTGAGGKTTNMFWLAKVCAARGKRVLVSTTTHIVKPKQFYADNAEEVRTLWAEGNYAVIGSPEKAKDMQDKSDGKENQNTQEHQESQDNQIKKAKKLTAPEEEVYRELAKEADLVLLEADGAKGFPCKVPAVHEPVIPRECDLVIGVFGMSALDRPLKKVCFRFAEEGEWLGITGTDLLTEEIAAEILSSEKGTRKGVGSRTYIALLNQCDDQTLTERAERIAKLFQKNEIAAILMSHQGKTQGGR